MGLWVLPHNSANFCSFLMKLHIRVQETTSYKKSTQNVSFGYVPVIWHNWAKKGPNMVVALPRALVGGWGSGDVKCSVGRQVFGETSSFRQDVKCLVRRQVFSETSSVR